MHSLVNSEDPDEMPHHARFHRDLHYLLRQYQSLEEEIYFLEIISCDPSLYTVDHPKLIVSNKDKSISAKRLNIAIPFDDLPECL